MPSLDALRLHASPTPMEINEIERAIQDDGDTIVGYLDAIVAIQQTLLTLRTQLDTVYASAALKRAVIAPIRRLPPEIIGSILTYVLHDSERTSRCLLHHPVLRTCRLWRDLAFSTPIAWSFIQFYLDYDVNWCAVLKTLMGLAGTRPVHLELVASTTRFSGNHELRCSEEDITGLLVSSAGRWQTLRLCNVHLPPWFSAETLPLTLLRSVNLTKVTVPTTDSASPSAALPVAHFERCPALTHVSLVDTDIGQLCLPLAQLLHLDVLLNRDDLVAPCIEALGACQALTSLELILRAPDHAPHIEIQLPSLEYLMLSREASSMLKILRTPKLSRLRGYANFNDILQYAQRQDTIRSTVTSLSLTAAKVSEAGWTRLLKLYPKLTRLDLLNRPTYRTDWFDRRSPSEFKEELQLMRALSHHPDLLPDLTYLHLRRFEVRGPENIQVIEDLVEARTGCPSLDTPGLKGIHFAQCKSLEDWDRLTSTLAGRIQCTTDFGRPRAPFVERDSMSPRLSQCASDTSDDREDSEEGSPHDLDDRSGGLVSTDSEVSESGDESEDADVNLVTLEEYVDDSDDDGRWAWEAHPVDEFSVDEEWIHPGNMSYEADGNAIPPHDLDDERPPYNLRSTKFPIHRLAPRRY
ncbi:hypothetical protein GGF50DRAFT_113745 [Schizophyllum commune]